MKEIKQEIKTSGTDVKVEDKIEEIKNDAWAVLKQKETLPVVDYVRLIEQKEMEALTNSNSKTLGLVKLLSRQSAHEQAAYNTATYLFTRATNLTVQDALNDIREVSRLAIKQIEIRNSSFDFPSFGLETLRSLLILTQQDPKKLTLFPMKTWSAFFIEICVCIQNYYQTATKKLDSKLIERHKKLKENMIEAWTRYNSVQTNPKLKIPTECMVKLADIFQFSKNPS